MILLSINRLKLRAMRTGEETMSAATDRLHIGNRWINHAGLGYYDNTARYYDALTVRFTAADQLEWKYYSLSPWAHCAGNPVNFIDPSGLESIYVYRNKQLEKVGETNPNDPNNYIVKDNKKSINKVLESVENGEDLSNSDYLVRLPNAEAFGEIENSLADTQETHVEQGGHVDRDGNISRWDPGASYKDGETKISISPFIIDGNKIKEQHTVNLYWHVHPKVDFSNGNTLGSSDPSPGDKSYENDMRNSSYKGSTLLVGGRKEEITFYYRNKVITIIPIKVLKTLYEK